MSDETYCPKCMISCDNRIETISPTGKKLCGICKEELIPKPIDAYRTTLYNGLMKQLDKYRLQSWDILAIVDQVREIEANAIIEANYGYFRWTNCQTCGCVMIPRVYGNDEYRCCSCIHEGDE
jgi:hypothetical protein